MSMTIDVLLLDSGVWIATRDAKDRWEAPSRELAYGRRRTAGALDLTLYEVANTVGAMWRRDAEAAELCRSVERRCARRIVRMDGDLIRTTIEVAIEHHLTSYDAAYVAVARRRRWTLVSTDIRDLVSKGLAITPDAAV
jgi:predicted nucleic acid-binding protein